MPRLLTLVIASRQIPILRLVSVLRVPRLNLVAILGPNSLQALTISGTLVNVGMV